MSDHQWTKQHLAWYVNGTLVGEEYAQAHRHLSECVVCQKEHAQLKQLSQGVGAEATLPLNSAAALAELQPQLAASSGVGIVSGFLAVLRQSPASIRYLVAIQGVALGIMAGFLFLAPPTADTVLAYTTLSSSNSVGGDLRLVFSAQSTEQQRALLLQSHGLELIGEVSDRGIATVKWSRQYQQETLNSLRTRPEILLAEPIGDVIESDP